MESNLERKQDSPSFLKPTKRVIAISGAHLAKLQRTAINIFFHLSSIYSDECESLNSTHLLSKKTAKHIKEILQGSSGKSVERETRDKGGFC